MFLETIRRLACWGGAPHRQRPSARRRRPNGGRGLQSSAASPGAAAGPWQPCGRLGCWRSVAWHGSGAMAVARRVLGTPADPPPFPPPGWPAASAWARGRRRERTSAAVRSGATAGQRLSVMAAEQGHTPTPTTLSPPSRSQGTWTTMVPAAPCAFPHEGDDRARVCSLQTASDDRLLDQAHPILVIHLSRCDISRMHAKKIEMA